MATEPYKRIACGLYDELEVLAMRHTLVHIKYRDEQSNQLEVDDVIINLKSIEKVEYAILKSGLKFRLDWIFQINDLVIQENTSCNL